MRWVGIFMAISAVALGIVFFCTRGFDPGVNLPQIDAGKPFNRWDGIVVTCMPDGKIHLDGTLTERTDAVNGIKEAVKARQAEFTEVWEKVPDRYRGVRASMVPVLLILDKDARLELFLPILDILYRAGCVNVYLAAKKGDDFRAIAVCTPTFAGSGRFYWRDKMFRTQGTVVEIRAKVNDGGKYRFYTVSTDSIFFVSKKRRKRLLMVVEPFGTGGLTPDGTRKSMFALTQKPRTYDNIEPLFDLVQKYQEKEFVVVLDIHGYSKNLRWEWLVKLLARLEKTDIKGYAFAAPEVGY